MSTISSITLSITGENKALHGALIANVLDAAKTAGNLKPNGVIQIDTVSVSLVDCKIDGVDGFYIIIDSSNPTYTPERLQDLIKPYAHLPYTLVFNDKSGIELPLDLIKVCDDLKLPQPKIVSIKLGKNCLSTIKRSAKRIIRKKTQ